MNNSELYSKLTVHFKGLTLCAGCVAGVTDSEAELSSISTDGTSGASEGDRELSGPDAAESFVSVFSSVAPVVPSVCPFACNKYNSFMVWDRMEQWGNE
jgi:hypothetical protein